HDRRGDRPLPVRPRDAHVLDARPTSGPGEPRSRSRRLRVVAGRLHDRPPGVVRRTAADAAVPPPYRWEPTCPIDARRTRVARELATLVARRTSDRLLPAVLRSDRQSELRRASAGRRLG